MLLVSFNTPWKLRKRSGFLMFSGGIERDQWHVKGYLQDPSKIGTHLNRKLQKQKEITII